MAKVLLNHEAVRRQFISDVLGIPMDEIKSVRIRNPFLGRSHKGQNTGNAGSDGSGETDESEKKNQVGI